MTVLILAAGAGTRLGGGIPKGLLTLPTGETILGRQVRIMRTAGINEIVVVVGYRREVVQAALDGVVFRYNDRFAQTNTAKSLLLGLDGVAGDVLWTNGDVVFEQSIIDDISSRRVSSILVNTAHCGEEEVKYRADSDGWVTAISKKLDNARGEALGVNLITGDMLTAFRTALSKCGDNDYFEHALQKLIDTGGKFKTLDVGQRQCIEVDFESDWEAAQAMFRTVPEDRTL